MVDTPLKRYRAIAIATRKRLDRARTLYARLTWPTVVWDLDPRVAHWDAALRAVRSGLYSPKTAVTDAAMSLACKWFEWRVGGSRAGVWSDWAKRNRIEIRMSAREVERLRVKRDEKLRSGTTPPPAAADLFVIGYWGE